jgi:UDP-N-acetylglucosamine:LPS N-acetylglucosamine transferase
MLDARTHRIDVWYFNAGGGHRAAARALDEVVRDQHRNWQVRAFNIMEVLDPQGWYKRVTGTEPEDYYNVRLRTGFTLGLAQELKVFQAMVRVWHPAIVNVLQQHYLRTEPDLVVSVIPNLNRPMCEALATTLPGVPYVTVMTDIADFPPDFWIVPDQPHHVICGSDRAMQQARELGCHESRVHRMSGMILRPSFHEPLHIDRAAERRALGLDPDRPTGVVLFGGHGSRVMAAIAQELDDVQLILMCGHNAALARRLRSLKASAPRAVVEFTPEVRRYMQLGDFFIGKPGPGSLSEAVHVGLPVVTVRNAWTMPQERYNTEWVRENGLGVVATSMRKVGQPVRELLARLPEFSANVARMPPNRAIFEVPEILERILAGAPAAFSPLAMRSLPDLRGAR